MCDTCVPKTDQVIEYQTDAEVFINNNRVNVIPIDGAIDENEANIAVDTLIDRRIFASCCCNDQAFDLSALHYLHRLESLILVVVCICGNDCETDGLGRVLNASDDWRKQRIRQVGNEYADCEGAVLLER